MTIYPLLIQPRFDERIWGGHQLAEKLGKDAPRDRPVGESWEVYEENRVLNGPLAGKTIGELRHELGERLMGHVPADELFPLLTKLIDAEDVLSVQVHPDDAYARKELGQPYGKTECWYIIDAAPGAELIYGFSRDSGPEEYRELVKEGKLEEILRPLPVQAGDVVYLPARTVHAIGAGILLFELQQTSDVTYRIYDWNRVDAGGKPRELHVDRAADVLDYHRFDRGTIRPLRLDGRTMLIAGRYFCLELVEGSGNCRLETHESPVPICMLAGGAVVETEGVAPVEVAPYSSVVIPAGCGQFTIRPAQSGTFRALVAYVPVSEQATREELIGRGFGPDEVDRFLQQFAPV